MAISLEQASSGSFSLTKAGLAIGSTTSQLSTAASTTHVIDGVFKTAKGATADFALSAATGFTITTPITAGNKCCLGVWLDSSGNFKITQGPLTPFSASTDKAAPPPNPGGMAPVGVVVVQANSATFTPGTTAFNAATATVTYYDVMSIPASGLA
jgi:hypothetical protein